VHGLRGQGAPRPAQSPRPRPVRQIKQNTESGRRGHRRSGQVEAGHSRVDSAPTGVSYLGHSGTGIAHPIVGPRRQPRVVQRRNRPRRSTPACPPSGKDTRPRAPAPRTPPVPQTHRHTATPTRNQRRCSDTRGNNSGKGKTSPPHRRTTAPHRECKRGEYWHSARREQWTRTAAGCQTSPPPPSRVQQGYPRGRSAPARRSKTTVAREHLRYQRFP